MSLRVLGYVAGARQRKFMVAAKVGGVNVTFENIDFGKDNESEPWLKNCHPCGRAPVLDAGADGYIFESNAILRYFLRVAEKNGKSLYGRSIIEASQVDQWIDFASSEIEHNSYPILYTALGFAALSEAELEGKYAALSHALQGLETWLETRTFLVGERLSGADIAVATAVEVALAQLPKSSELWKFKNVVRYYLTVFYASPGYAEAQKLNGGTGFPVEKPKEAPKPKEVAKPKEAAPAAAAAAGGDDDDEEPAAEEPKKKNALDELPPSPFVLDAFKREYSNNKDTRNGVMKYLQEQFDAKGFSLWFCRYKYNDELTKVFMTSNLVRGWFQRMEGVRKYAFGVALTLGTEEKHEIQGFWIFRGNSGALPDCVKDVEDTTLYDWRPASLETEKDLIADFLCWDGKNLPKPCLEGRTFK